MESGHGLTDQPANVVQKISYSYDALGRKTSETDANNNTQTWSFNYFGRLTSRKDFQLNQTDQTSFEVPYSYTYDHAGQLVTQQSRFANGEIAQNLQYIYDGGGQLIQIKDFYLGQTTRYTYDLGGRRVSEWMAQQTRLADGNQTEVVYQNNRMGYDSQGRLRVALDSNSSVIMAYDKADNRIYTKTTMNGVIQEDFTYSYDAMNRQTSGQNRMYTYDY